MHHGHISQWEHQHIFSADKKHLERRTLAVVILTIVTMAAEIAAGMLTNSMALLADGWHMGTHAVALSISLFAFMVSRKHAHDRRYSFGTWKIEILGAHTSAVVLGIVGLMMAAASIERLINPARIHYEEALIVAGLGLAVNLASAAILNVRSHRHVHGGGQPGGHHGHDHEDLNLKSAFMHVIADALTSVIAIAALFGAKYFSLNQLDPLMGLAGTALILRWSYLLLRETSGILLDRDSNPELSEKIRQALESDGDTTISDFHLWRVSDRQYACIVSVVSKKIRHSEDYRNILKQFSELSHVTVEVYRCTEC